ncbi:DegV family protein [Bailinhaonella thermotolerans]|nr:DegV family protein [Bailinhaonella thermotolerans]
MSVAVVTDSTAYLASEEIARFGVTVVPLQVVIGGRVLEDVSEVGASDVAEALKSWSPVTTSRPAPSVFLEAYGEAAARGATGVVSVHLSAELSGTVEAARLAAEKSGIPVMVVDTRSLGMGLGFPVIAAAEAATRGEPLNAVAGAASRCASRTRSWFYVDTLEHLRRGGRIGAAASLVGTALMIKPLLHIADGAILPLEKVRTSARAIARMEDLAVTAAAGNPVDVAVQHLAAPGRAAELAERLAARVPSLRRLHVGEVGAVIGAHVGPGMLGVVVSPVVDGQPA